MNAMTGCLLDKKTKKQFEAMIDSVGGQQGGGTDELP
jgi:hypothetical protein